MKRKILIICCLLLASTLKSFAQIHIISDKAEMQEIKNGKYQTIYTSYETVNIYIYEKTISIGKNVFVVESKELKQNNTGKSYTQYETKDNEGNNWSLIFLGRFLSIALNGDNQTITTFYLDREL